jgi:hypothetical protein
LTRGRNRRLAGTAVKGAAGFLIGLAVWSGLSVPYARLLASASAAAVRIGERPPVTSITAQGTLMVVDRSDFRRTPSSIRLAVESTDITFNVILLFALFAASGRTFSDRNVFGFLAAAAALSLAHVAAVVSFVEAHYAESFGAWSAMHYGYVARHLWSRAPYFYSVVGAYGFAVALWWLFRPLPQQGEGRPLDGRRRPREARRDRT